MKIFQTNSLIFFTLTDGGCVTCILFYCFFFSSFYQVGFLFHLPTCSFTTKNKQRKKYVVEHFIFLRQSKYKKKNEWRVFKFKRFKTPLLFIRVYTEHDKHCIVQTFSNLKLDIRVNFIYSCKSYSVRKSSNLKQSQN